MVRAPLACIALCTSALVALSGGVAQAAGSRAQIAVAPFVAAGPHAEELAYFAPEVTRAIVAALQRLGIEVGEGGEWPITGQLESLPDERVRLTGQLRGRSATVEGTVEDIDVLVDQLSAKLVGLLVEIERPRASPASPSDLHAHPSPRARAGHPANPNAPVGGPLPTLPEPVKVAAPAADAKSEPPQVKTVSAEVAPPPAPEKGEKSEPAPETRTENAAPVGFDKALPAKPPVTHAPAEEPAYPAFVPNFVAGRVVAHAVADAPSSYVGTGQAASQALYLFLNRRLRLSIVPTGIGLSSLQTAGLEGQRSGARFVVMMRLKEVVYGPAGVHCRIEVVVARQGQLVYRRVVDSPPQSPTSRGREDPVFAAVMLGLDALYPELLPLLTNGL